MRHLRAFTLMELAVGMAISSMVMLAGGFGYHLLTKQVSSFHNKKSMLLQAMMLQTLLYAEFDSAISVSYTDNELSIKTPDGEAIKYQFRHMNIVRKFHSRADTFHLEPKHVLPSYLNINANNRGFIDALEFHLKIGADWSKYSIQKKYDAAWYIGLSNNN